MTKSHDKSVAIVQSSYIPWKGYFDLINLVDEVIVFDDAQYTRRDWRNRNRVKTQQRGQWLTVPVHVSGLRSQRIRDVRVSDPTWRRRHWNTIRHSYARAPWFHEYAELLAEAYARCDSAYLTDVNLHFIRTICGLLAIETKISRSSDYQLRAGRSERLIGLCHEAGATRYVSGPSARAYLDESLFAAESIDVHYMDYSGYPEYPQLHGPFEHAVTILDLFFHVGPAASRYMKSFAAQTTKSPTA